MPRPGPLVTERDLRSPEARARLESARRGVYRAQLALQTLSTLPRPLGQDVAAILRRLATLDNALFARIERGRERAARGTRVVVEAPRTRRDLPAIPG